MFWTLIDVSDEDSRHQLGVARRFKDLALRLQLYTKLSRVNKVAVVGERDVSD
jgi:hypothetical protein